MRIFQKLFGSAQTVPPAAPTIDLTVKGAPPAPLPSLEEARLASAERADQFELVVPPVPAEPLGTVADRLAERPGAPAKPWVRQRIFHAAGLGTALAVPMATGVLIGRAPKGVPITKFLVRAFQPGATVPTFIYVGGRRGDPDAHKGRPAEWRGKGSQLARVWAAAPQSQRVEFSTGRAFPCFVEVDDAGREFFHPAWGRTAVTDVLAEALQTLGLRSTTHTRSVRTVVSFTAPDGMTILWAQDSLGLWWKVDRGVIPGIQITPKILNHIAHEGEWRFKDGVHGEVQEVYASQDMPLMTLEGCDDPVFNGLRVSNK